MRVVCNLCCPRCDSGSTATFCQASKERLPYPCWGWCCGSTAGKSKQLIASIRPTGRAAKQAAWQSGGVPVESASLSEAITIYVTIFVRKFRFYVCQGGNLPPPPWRRQQFAACCTHFAWTDHRSQFKYATYDGVSPMGSTTWQLWQLKVQSDH